MNLVLPFLKGSARLNETAVQVSAHFQEPLLIILVLRTFFMLEQKEMYRSCVAIPLFSFVWGRKMGSGEPSLLQVLTVQRIHRFWQLLIGY